MIILPISLTIAAGAALLNLWLSIRVGRVRTKEKVFVGDGGNELVTRRMRAHSNFVENTAFVLILLALVELGLGSSMWLWGVGALVSGRPYLARDRHGRDDVGPDGRHDYYHVDAAWACTRGAGDRLSDAGECHDDRD